MASRRRPAARRQQIDRTEDFYKQVAEDLIEKIERGTARWTQAWKPGEKLLPENVRTGNRYRGGNSVWLASVADSRGYSDHRWGTYKQVREMGGQVRRGEKGSAILFWRFETRKPARDAQGRPVLDEHGKQVYDVKPLAVPHSIPYTVFNAEQCDGLPAPERGIAGRSWSPVERAESILKGSGAGLEHAGRNRAYYDLRRDRIILPYKEQFPDAPGYYQTALHELGHWTGHPDRLARESLLRGIEEGFASPHYAREELRAEISSMMTCQRIELGHSPDRPAAYVASWIQALRDDPREIYRAAQDAQNISDYVLDLARERESARTPVPAPDPPAEAAAGESPAPPGGAVTPPPQPAAEPGEQYRLFQRGRPSLAALAREASAPAERPQPPRSR